MADRRDMTGDTRSEALVESLREQVEYLKDTVARRDEEIRRRDHLLAAALERIPALDAPPEAPETPLSSSGGGGNGMLPPEQEKTVEQVVHERQVPWWKRWLGVEP